ncbi:12503_t:CDS:10 [Entrophospora sp. SA101]|nr:12503_t:CDS:10 [Entrophospora sp. SA101]
MLLSCNKVETRLLDGSDNNKNNPASGTPQQNFQAKYPPEPFFGPDGDSMIKCPSDIVNDADLTQKPPNCADPLPADNYPMPRCISNILANYRLGKFDIGKAMSYRSKRRTSHLTTFFAEFVGYDLISSSNNVKSDHQLYIPSDDKTYNSYSYSSLPGQLSDLRFLPFNRSDFLNTTTQKSKRTSYNNLTPFLDLSPIYGVTAENAKSLREGNRGKLKTSGNGADTYPFKDPTTGNYVLGPVGARSNNIFTMAVQTIWLREHNRLCDDLYEKNNTWTDDQYFEEARKWNIAIYQKVVMEEYLGVILGKQLPPYQKYDPALTPGIDVFFSTVTFKYGHSELSDFFRIQDEYGSTIMELPLQNVTDTSLLEKFGVARLLISLSLQYQEESDVYYSDATRNINSPEPNTYDLAAFDVLRARDRGIGLYNDVRQAYGLNRKDSWESITSVKEIQDYLKQLYPNGPNQLEASVGIKVEDNLIDSNFGELMNTSMVTQFMAIRDSDRFWWENEENGLFTDQERSTELRNKTTFRDIIIRNLDNTFQAAIPQNIWTVQPPQKLPDSPSKYSGHIDLWPSAYVISYEIVENYINFQVQILTTGGNAWFGMGFDPNDKGGMIGADFVIGIISNGNLSSLSNYQSNPTDYRPPIPYGDDSDLKLINYTPPDRNNFAIVEFSRLLVPNGRKGITKGYTKYILAYNPTSSILSYHQNNRRRTLVDFYNNQISSSSVPENQRLVKLAHGIGMLLTAIATTINPSSIHAWLGTSVFALLFIELGSGLISIWGQVAIVSVNQGYPRLLKRIHRFFGFSLLASAWTSVYFGIDIYCLLYGFESYYYKIAYLIWIGIVIATFIFGEYWWNWKGTFRWKYTLSNFEKENQKKKSLFLLHIPKEDYDKLPEFTWNEVNERVQHGAYLVVCDGFIVNMRKWIRVHPGGAKILERVIGTDITNDFFGYKGKDIIEFIDLPEIKSVPTSYSPSILGQYSDILLERTKKYTTGKNSVAQVVDDMNVKYFLKAPLAIHPHSLFAIKKIATMIVAKLKETPAVESQPAPIFGPINVADGGGLSDEEMAKQDTAFRVKFRRYKLTSKVPINGSNKFPVMKFTLTIVHQNEGEAYNNHHHKLKFLPGHYIEVQSRIKGQVVIRSYTPIEGNIAKSFSIFVKVYPDGLMSKHLSEQLKGYEIQVRGPFDVGDRKNLQTSMLSQVVDSASQHRKSSSSAKTIPSFISSSTSSLLNPNTPDGHWHELFMICGGTGITPMLQLITYHLELCMRRNHASTIRNKRVSMHLLYSNRKIEDIINGVELEEYRLSSRDMLTITYALNEPPQVWSGKNGNIDKEMISDCSPTSPTSPTIPQLFKNHSSHGGSLTSSTNRNKRPNIIDFTKNDNTANTTNSPEYLTMTPPPQSSTPLSINNSIIDTRPGLSSVNDDNFISKGYSNSIITITANNKKKPKLDPNSKIMVCGPTDMINVVEQSLKNLGYTEEDFILIT